MEETRIRPDYQEELLKIVRSNITPLALREILSGYHDSDIAQILGDLGEGELEKILRSLDTESISDILEYVDDNRPYIKNLPMKKKVAVLSAMEEDSAADYLKDAPRMERDIILDLMDEETRKNVSFLVSFSEDEIGSEMTTNFVKVRKDLSIKEAMSSLVAQAAENDNISTLYVTDENDRFYGAIDLKDLIIAREGQKLETIITTSYPYVYAEDLIDDTLERLKEYSEDSIPVLDYDNSLIGVITAQNMIDIVDDEMSEDYAMLGGLTAEEDLNEPVKTSVKKRLPWLMILLVLGLGVSSVVGAFEGVISQLTLIIAFQSLVLDMAGNVGTQSLAVTIRVLMDENLSMKDKWRLIGKEASVGALNGILLCIISFVAAGLYIMFAKGGTALYAFSISGCLGLSLFVAMIMSSLAGTTVPMILKRIKVDPAVASGPFITTINDLIAVIVYYGLAWIFLINILHLGA